MILFGLEILAASIMGIFASYSLIDYWGVSQSIAQPLAIALPAFYFFSNVSLKCVLAAVTVVVVAPLVMVGCGNNVPPSIGLDAAKYEAQKILAVRMRLKPN